MKGIYLAAFKAIHPGYDIVYQDINGKRDIPGDMMDIDLSPYDFIIATPPCNYWSRANYRRERSEYSQMTKHLLPGILKKLCAQDKPFIVENVRNDRMFTLHHLYELPCHIYKIGRHTYWTNIMFSCDVEQRQDFKYGGYFVKDLQNLSRSDRQGGYNVQQVIERWLDTLKYYI